MFLVLTRVAALVLAAGLGSAASVPADLSVVRSSFAGRTASFTLVDLSSGRRVDLDERTSQVPLAPCSTFKIAHGAIALEERVVRDVDAVERWDGVVRANAAWNRDHSMRTAIRDSTVWFFQRMARRLGAEREARWLRRLGYGNAAVGEDVTTFWLNGPLRITPRGQAAFLTRFLGGQLPFSSSTVAAVKSAMQLSNAHGVVLRGKTGTCGTVTGPTLGWFVGVVERASGSVVFVTTLQGGPNRTGRAARDLTEAALRELRLLP